MAELNYKAIVTIPAWASRMLEGDSVEPDRIETAARAYTYVPLIRRAVRLRANALVRPQLVLRNKAGDEVDWPFDTKARKLLWNTEASILLMGAGYNEKIVRERSKKVLDLRWVNPTGMIVSYDAKQADELDRFKFQQGEKGGQWTLRDMVYLREFSLADDIQPGDSATKNAMTNAGLTRFMSRFASTFFEKGAMPLTIVSVEGLTDKDEVSRMQKGLRKMMTGIRRAFNLVVLNKSLETKVLTQPLRDMVFPDLYDQAVVEIAHAFEIPEAMLTSANNRSVTEEHRLSFWQDTIQPRGEWLADQYNEQVFEGMGLTAEFAFDELDVFQEDETKRSTSVETLTRAINTDAEAALFVMKNILGYELSDQQLQEYDEMFLQKPEPPAVPPPPQPGQVPPQGGQEPPEAPQAPQDGQEAPQASARAVDLEKWQRKALKLLERGKGAGCTFESGHIPDETRWQIQDGLKRCETAEQVRELFAGYAEADQEQEGGEEIKALVEAIKLEVAAIQRSTPPVSLAVHNYPGEKPEVKVENLVQVPETVVNVAMPEMKAEFAQPSITVNVPEQSPPVVHVSVPEQKTPVVHVTNEVKTPEVKVTNEVQPAEVTINTPRSAVLKDGNGRVIRRLQAD